MHTLLFTGAQLLTPDVTSILTVGHLFIEIGRSDTLHLLPSSVASCALWVRLLEFCWTYVGHVIAKQQIYDYLVTLDLEVHLRC